MKNSILAFLLMLPMLSFGQPVQLSVFYKQKAEMHESQRDALRKKAGVSLVLEIDSPYQLSDEVTVDGSSLKIALVRLFCHAAASLNPMNFTRP